MLVLLYYDYLLRLCYRGFLRILQMRCRLARKIDTLPAPILPSPPTSYQKRMNTLEMNAN